MNPLRYVLMLVSAAGAIFTLYLAKDVAHSDPGGAMILLAIGGALALNAIYMMAQAPRSSSLKPFRMARLWMDAKEAELQDRATRRPGQRAGSSAEPQRKS
jgi:hypothetical protein